MKLHISHQSTYSKKELLLRTFFGVFYIYIPHLFMMGIFGIWSNILGMIAFWVILFTGKYPKSWFEYQVSMQKWNLRFKARTGNLADGYPAFNPSGTDDRTSLDIPYREFFSRGKLLLRTFFGVFMIFPHAFILIFRMWWGAILGMIAWWIILFTGKYPANWHSFNVENIRWMTRISCFMGNLIEEYPPFHGREESEAIVAENTAQKTRQVTSPVPLPKPVSGNPVTPAENNVVAAGVKPITPTPPAVSPSRVIYMNKISDASCEQTPDKKFAVSFTVESRKFQVDANGTKKEIQVCDTIEIGMLKIKTGSAAEEIYLKGHFIKDTISKISIIVNEKPDKIGIDPYNKLPEK